jgi:hypothetical protein
MAYKWTEGDARSGNILDVDEFNSSFNNVKGEINGGLDRENLPNNSIGDAALAPNAFIKYAVVPNIKLQGDETKSLTWAGGAGATVNYKAISYNSYSGGWRTNSAQSVNDIFQEGMLHLEFNCWYYLNNHASGGDWQLWCQFQILVDGSPVVTADRQYQNVGQVHIAADVPVSTGKHLIQIRWRVSAMLGGMPIDNAIFYYDGGQLLVLNRYR